MIDESFDLRVLLAEYEKAFLTCHVLGDAKPQVTLAADRLLQLRDSYEAVEQKAGIPWWFAGILHYLEWDFKEPDRFTREVSSILIDKKFNQAKTRTLGAYLWGFDLWNGFRDGAGDESEWVWQGTDILGGAREQVESKAGAAAIVHYLMSLGKIDIPKPDHKILLRTLVGTTFKTSAGDSSKLSEEEKLSVAKGLEVPVLENVPAHRGHVKLVLPDGSLNGQSNRNEWYVFQGHIEILGTDPNNQPMDSFVEPVAKIAEPNKGPAITLPKLGKVHLGSPILAGGHFSWAEVTKNGQRIPVSADIVSGIVRVAKAMEEVRSYLGDHSIRINSWYRDPVTNRQVGGAKDSRHLYGDAVDFYLPDIPPAEVHRRLDGWWNSRGGLASAKTFTHLDTRGYRARWHY